MEKNFPYISVIIPIYNAEKYLHQCIDSVLNQELNNIEIILVDDGSTDTCPSICDKYAVKDSRIKVIHQNNQGLLKSRVNGTIAALAPYITFVDADDYIASNHLSSLWQIIEEKNVDMVACSHVELCTKKTKQIQAPFNGFYGPNDMEKCISDYLYTYIGQSNSHHFCYSWNKVTKKELLLHALSLVDNRIQMGEDVVTSLAILTQISTMYTLADSYTYFYRVHNNSMCRVYQPDIIEDSQRMFLCFQAIPLPQTCEDVRNKMLPSIRQSKLLGILRNQYYLGFKKLYSRSKQLVAQLHGDAFWGRYMNEKIALSPKANVLYWALAHNHIFFYCVLFVPFCVWNKIKWRE